MKIENIIEDIIGDVVDLKSRLEAHIKLENPGLKFKICLPEIEKLSAIKLVEISIEDEQATYTFRVEIHTHNGNRVFENSSTKIINGQEFDELNRIPLYDWFINVVRDIIKRRKLLKKMENRPGR